MLEPQNFFVLARLVFAVVKIFIQGARQNIVEQSGFAAAGNAGDADKFPQRNVYVNIF